MGWGESSETVYYRVELTGGAVIGATVLLCKRLEVRLLANTPLTFGGVLSGKVAIPTATAQAGATSVTVAPLPAALSLGDVAIYGSVDLSEPREWEDSATEDDPTGWVRAQHLNAVLDQEAYLGGRQAPGGTYVTVAATATAGAESVTIEPLEEPILATQVPLALFFSPGDGKYARVLLAAPEGSTELVTASLPTELDPEDAAPWPPQGGTTKTELDAALQVPEIGAVAEVPRLDVMNQFVSGGSSLFQLLATKASGATGASDTSDLLFLFRKTDGTEELMARIRARKDGTGTSIDISTATGGVFPATAAITVRYTRRVGVKNAAPNFTMDVVGAIDCSGTYRGLALWRENPAGRLTHTGDARVTGQLRSTVATGTPPIQLAANAGLVRGLNSAALQGHVWPVAALTNASSATLDTAGVSIAATAADEDGLWFAAGSAVVDVVTGDEGATFSVVVSGSPAAVAPGIRLPTVGFRSQVVSFGLNSLVDLDAITILAKKNGGSGATAASGLATAVRYGFEAA